jgi:hypothetical protein
MEHMVCISQYWTYERGQEGTFLTSGVTDGDIGLLRGVDCENLAQDFNSIDRILIPPRYTFFFGSQTTKNSGVKRA